MENLYGKICISLCNHETERLNFYPHLLHFDSPKATVLSGVYKRKTFAMVSEKYYFRMATQTLIRENIQIYIIHYIDIYGTCLVHSYSNLHTCSKKLFGMMSVIYILALFSFLQLVDSNPSLKPGQKCCVYKSTAGSARSDSLDSSTEWQFRQSDSPTIFSIPQKLSHHS